MEDICTTYVLFSRLVANVCVYNVHSIFINVDFRLLGTQNNNEVED